MKKVTIVGAGNVGAHIASNLIHRNLEATVYLVDMNEAFEAAQVLDLKDMSLQYQNTRIEGAEFGDKSLRESDVVVITAGAKQNPGETRLDLLGKNTAILKSIAQGIGALKPEAIVMLVSNPVDILTHVAEDLFDLPQGHVFGSGTLLDTGRLRWRLAEELGRDISDVTGYVMGEHGDSEFVSWSSVEGAEHISAPHKKEIESHTRKAAYEIIKGKGATYFGIGAAAGEIVECILRNESKVFPVSAPLRGEYGLRDVSLGVPALVGHKGVEKVIELELSPRELAKLHKSADMLRELFN